MLHSLPGKGAKSHCLRLRRNQHKQRQARVGLGSTRTGKNLHTTEVGAVSKLTL